MKRSAKGKVEPRSKGGTTSGSWGEKSRLPIKKKIRASRIVYQGGEAGTRGAKGNFPGGFLALHRNWVSPEEGGAVEEVRRPMKELSGLFRKEKKTGGP